MSEREWMSRVSDVVAYRYGVPFYLMTHPTRLGEVSHARRVAMFVIHACFGIRDEQIAEYFNRERSTVNYHRSVMRDIMAVEPEERERVFKIKQIIDTEYHIINGEENHERITKRGPRDRSRSDLGPIGALAAKSGEGRGVDLGGLRN